MVLRQLEDDYNQFSSGLLHVTISCIDLDHYLMKT